MVKVHPKMTLKECMALGNEPTIGYLSRWQTLERQVRISEKHRQMAEGFLAEMKEFYGIKSLIP